MDLNDTVPLAEEKNIELDHDYDGIKELDNLKRFFYYSYLKLSTGFLEATFRDLSITVSNAIKKIIDIGMANNNRVNSILKAYLLNHC